MAGACASEANGKPKATTDKRERRSLFMDTEVKKSTAYCLITCRDLCPKFVAELVGALFCGFESCLE